MQYGGGYGFNTFINTTDASSNYGNNNFTYDFNHPIQYLSSFDQPYLDSFPHSQMSSRNPQPKSSATQGKKAKKIKVP